MTLEFVDPPGVWIRTEYHDADMVIVRDVIEEDCYRIRDLPRPIHFAMDIGAHIGAFSVALSRQRPESKIACVEANPANIECLKKNAVSVAMSADRQGRQVEPLAIVSPCACTYAGHVRLLSSVFDGTQNTGGSFVEPFTKHAWKQLPNAHEYRDAGNVRSRTLDSLLDDVIRWPQIDVLKLDCEGSEFSILEKARCLDRIGVIVGEQHDEKRFAELVERRFPRDEWTLDILRGGTPGLFRLSRADWWNMAGK